MLMVLMVLLGFLGVFGDFGDFGDFGFFVVLGVLFFLGFLFGLGVFGVFGVLGALGGPSSSPGCVTPLPVFTVLGELEEWTGRRPLICENVLGTRPAKEVFAATGVLGAGATGDRAFELPGSDKLAGADTHARGGVDAGDGDGRLAMGLAMILATISAVLLREDRPGVEVATGSALLMDDTSTAGESTPAL